MLTVPKTLGLLYERPADGRRTASAGYYNTAAFYQQTAADGFLAQSLNGDAFSNEMKTEAIDRLKADFGKIDVLVYSIAAPRRIHPNTGVSHQSELKPIGASYTGKTIDLSREVIAPVTIEPATEQEIIDTIAVMGGEDLEMWIDALTDAELLAPEVTVCRLYLYRKCFDLAHLPRRHYRQSKRRSESTCGRT